MNPIEKYFNAERVESLLFIIAGIMAIGFAAWFIFKTKQPYYCGMAYPSLL